MKSRQYPVLFFVSITIASIFLVLGSPAAQARESRSIPSELSITLCSATSACVSGLVVRLDEPFDDTQRGFVTWPDGQVYGALVFRLNEDEPILVLGGEKVNYSFIVPEYGTQTFAGSSPIDIFCPEGDCWRLIGRTERWWKNHNHERA